MITFKAIVRNDIRHLWRRRSFWIIQALLLAPMLLFALIIALDPNAAMSSGDARFELPGQVSLYLLFLFVPILVGPAVLRDQGEIGEILWTCPLDPLAHLGGVFSGLWLGLLPGAVFYLASGWLSGLFIPGYLSDLTWVYGALIYLVNMTVALALTFLLAAIIRRFILLLMTWAALWVGALVGVTGILEDLSYPLQTTSFFNVFFQGTQISPSLGLGLARGTILGMAAWFAGLSLTLTTLALLVSLVFDQRRTLRYPARVIMLALAAAVMLGGGYSANRAAVSAHALPPSPLDVQNEHWQVTDQVTHLDLDRARGFLSGESRLTIAPVAPVDEAEIVLRLNSGLEMSLAQDGAGQQLAVTRVGDSVVVQLLQVPREPFSLKLNWKGVLAYPYTNFAQLWDIYLSPNAYKYFAPQAAEAVLIDRVGFVLRDGDWQPWPWTAAPHQAQTNRLSIRVSGTGALASQPLQDSIVTWEGDIPAVLLAFPPSRQLDYGDMTLYEGRLAGSQHLATLQLFASNAQKLSALLGATPPTHVVALPYLSELKWQGNLLLIPDGSGYYISKALYWLYQRDLSGFNAKLTERSILGALARTWFSAFLNPEPLPYRPVTVITGQASQSVDWSGTSEAWFEQNGRWLRPPEDLDIAVTWTPRSNVELKPAGEFSAVGFWLALELADPEVRQADLENLALFIGQEEGLQGSGQAMRVMGELMWPQVLQTQDARVLVRDLHMWSQSVGVERAIAMIGEAMRESRPGSVGELLAELATRSGIRVQE